MRATGRVKGVAKAKVGGREGVQKRRDIPGAWSVKVLIIHEKREGRKTESEGSAYLCSPDQDTYSSHRGPGMSCALLDEGGGVEGPPEPRKRSEKS